MDFAGLLSPFPAEKFMAEHWEHRPLTVRHDDPGRYRELLSLADADYVLSNASLRSGELRVVNDGCETTPSDLEGPAPTERGRPSSSWDCTGAGRRCGA